MKLKFSGKTLRIYLNGAGASLYPGDTYDCDEHEGERLLSDFPKDFEKIEEKAISGKPNKAMKGAQNK